MGILSKITDFMGGGLFKEIKDTVITYFPPDMTPQQKLEAELKVEQFLHEKEKQTNRIISESAVELDRRISEQEGTAKDLQAIPVLGKLILFLRGTQRPAWGFAAMYMDFQWFFGGGEFNEQQQTALIVINCLVLGFLFGERAMLNLKPLIVEVFSKKKT